MTKVVATTLKPGPGKKGFIPPHLMATAFVSPMVPLGYGIGGIGGNHPRNTQSVDGALFGVKGPSLTAHEGPSDVFAGHVPIRGQKKASWRSWS